MRFPLLAAAALLGMVAPLVQSPGAQAQMDPHQHHRMAAPVETPIDHSAHNHDVGPAGSTYDVGSLGKTIWSDQAQEIKAMGQWRKAWYPEAPVYPVVLKTGGDPNAMADLTRMSPAQIQAMQMMASTPTRTNRVTRFLEGMLQHHGGALIMAHDALRKSTNPTILRLARNIIVAQRKEIIQLRKMLQHDGLNKPEYYQYDELFALN